MSRPKDRLSEAPRTAWTTPPTDAATPAKRLSHDLAKAPKFAMHGLTYGFTQSREGRGKTIISPIFLIAYQGVNCVHVESLTFPKGLDNDANVVTECLGVLGNGLLDAAGIAAAV